MWTTGKSYITLEFQGSNRKLRIKTSFTGSSYLWTGKLTKILNMKAVGETVHDFYVTWNKALSIRSLYGGKPLQSKNLIT